MGRIIVQGPGQFTDPDRQDPQQLVQVFQECGKIHGGRFLGRIVQGFADLLFRQRKPRFRSPRSKNLRQFSDLDAVIGRGPETGTVTADRGAAEAGLFRKFLLRTAQLRHINVHDFRKTHIFK